MKLAMRLPEKNRSGADNDVDPRDEATTEVIDLASRNSYPVVASRKGRSDAVGLAAGIGFVAVLGAATLWGLNAGRMDNGQADAPQVSAAPLPVAAVPVVDGLPSANAGAAVPGQPGVAPTDPAPSAVYSQQPQGYVAPAMNPYASPTLVFDGSPAGTSIMMPPAAIAAAAAAEGAAAPGGGAAGDFAARVGGVGGGSAVAQQSFNPATTVAVGTMIPAVLETAINTDVPGSVRAVVSPDVRSYDGSRVLLPRASRLVGQYQSGLQAGPRRAYVIWTQAIRPDGVTVALASPATGFDGTSGLNGEVDSHFFSRFGSAMLLSVIGGLGTIASGGASVVLGGGQSAATAALQQDGQRSPTVRVRMGEPVRVYTARNLDFGSAPRVR